jgi:hypothetical protein
LGSFTDWFCHYFTAVWFPQTNLNHRPSHSVADGDTTNRTGTLIRLPPRITRTDSDCFFLHTTMKNR